MKKVLLLTAVALLVAGSAIAGQIKNSKHNLSSTGNFAYRSTTVGSEVCIFCHAPHNPAKNIPLWNRLDPAMATFAFYNSTSINMVQASAVADTFSANSISKFCLSCHDGTQGLWAGVSNKFGKTYTMTNGDLLKGALAIGKDQLTNDHPVNIKYDPSVAGGATEFNTVALATGAGVKFLYDSTVDGGTQALVECASCHDPHKTTYGKFLRRTNDSSGLCLACHAK